MDFKSHLVRQQAYSHATFGPGRRTKGVANHIGKEIAEVEQSDGSPEEWVDIVILALDGLTRSLAFMEGDEMAKRLDPKWVAEMAMMMIEQKQTKNERRLWPDWRTEPKDKAIEHVKGVHD